MGEAVTLLFEIYSKFIEFIFDKLEILDGVTIGWIFVSILVFSVLIRSIMAIPSKFSNDIFRGDKNE